MSTPPFHVIIPARYASHRLPGKALLDIGGKPMIQHVVERCKQSAARSVVVATDDNRIVEVVKGFGADVILTSTDHPSGSDRIAEASRILSLEDREIIVNVQGDEPDMPAALIDQVALVLANDGAASMATACTLLEDHSQLTDPSVVKVVIDRSGYAMYFSRATIPWVRSENSSKLAQTALQHGRRHLGIYAYRAGYIQEFAARESCELENLEKLEQLRGLWYGDRILCVDAVQTPGPGIDTEQDLERARKAIS
jgi:3-deoxy-manno-octulosonate cytidylyltransferase (CMP-KDO synthetase)